MSTGETSGDMLAAALAEAMRARRADIVFEGIGGERMAAAGFSLTVETRGWASMGLFAALVRIVPLVSIALVQIARLLLRPADLIVLVDFGAFNLRFAKALRALGYRRPMLYYFPPGAWLDRASQAQAVARTTTALTAFARQRDFYRSLGLPIAYFGHPLAALLAPRPARAPAPATGGTVALLPGSRIAEVRLHMPRLVAACELLRAGRSGLDVVASVANDECEGFVRDALATATFPFRIVRGSRQALDEADAALVASGTAVLEAMLREVPSVALYVLSPSTAAYARRVWHGPYVTLPNLLLEREVIPELLQEHATPAALAAAVDAILHDPAPQRAASSELRALLGDAGAQDRAAEFALALASGEAAA
jgi:lipid-A-disaccharide synthase